MSTVRQYGSPHSFGGPLLKNFVPSWKISISETKFFSNKHFRFGDTDTYSADNRHQILTDVIPESVSGGEQKLTQVGMAGSKVLQIS